LSTKKRAAISQTMNKRMTTPSRASPGRARKYFFNRRAMDGAVVVCGMSSARDISAPPCSRLERRGHGVEDERDCDCKGDVGEHARGIHALGEMHDAVA